MTTDEPVKGVRVIEDGDVRTVVEALFRYGYSFACVKYFIPQKGKYIETEIELLVNEKDKMIKIALPTALKNARLFGETMFGIEKEFTDGTGYVLQRFCVLKGCALPK